MGPDKSVVLKTAIILGSHDCAGVGSPKCLHGSITSPWRPYVTFPKSININNSRDSPTSCSPSFHRSSISISFPAIYSPLISTPTYQRAPKMSYLTYMNDPGAGEKHSDLCHYS
ncbi:uncharacterized protein BDV14DRAFT_161565 [Aspergillus stella-maris]|uniref:uncharacterized protein n=1 Tax=Aspergillus stella-maris TaxID=1810926 RepID=UPI003CCCD67E